MTDDFVTLLIDAACAAGKRGVSAGEVIGALQNLQPGHPEAEAAAPPSPRALTKEEALKLIRQAQESGDTEGAHVDADDALCGFLEHLGHVDLVAEWHKVGKWHA